jgi:LuxR family transcriptional regulator, quorum-sensing system regulator SdiA
MTNFDFIDEELLKIGAIAPAGYFLGLRIRGASPLMAFQTYPQAWIEEYTGKGYVLRDPITTWAMTRGGVIRWSSPFLLDPFRILRRAAAHGLTYGASIAYGGLGSLTICSLSRADRELSNEEIAEAREVVVGLHDRVCLPDRLSDAQRELLAAMADDATEVAAAIGTSPAAADKAVRDICRTLIARSPAEALQRAREHNLF